MKVPSFLLAFLITIVIQNPLQIQAFRVIEINGKVTIFALENESISIQCTKDVAMSYCGFVHPTGKRFSFSGSELNNGRCVKKINATMDDIGIWTCHIGRQSTGVELVQKIELRVVDKFAALVKNVTAELGDSITLECGTTQGFLPLSYCRFEPPASAPFSINAAVNVSNAIQNRYTFPPNKSLDRGDCAVTIRKVIHSDFGIWTCGGGMSDGKEYTDSIMVTVEGLYTMSTATSVGLIFGALGIVAVLMITIYISYHKRVGSRRTPREGSAAVNEGHEMADMPVPRAPSPSRSVTPSRRSPTSSVRIPGLVVQSPSEPGSSPLMP